MDFIVAATLKAVKALYQTDITAADVNLQQTVKEFEGQVTIVTFPFTKFSRKVPEQTGKEVGEFLLNELAEVTAYNVVKGFLNLSIADSYWINQLTAQILKPDFGNFPDKGEKVMVEYSSPNTNKPLHLGHVRNNLLGFAVAQILKANGYGVVKANLVNDRGIHICKSMLAWQLFGNGETPESTGLKGDHLVGKYYVLFDKEMRVQLEPILWAIYSTGDLSAFNAQQQEKLNKHLQTVAKLDVAFTKEKAGLQKIDLVFLGDGASGFSDSISGENVAWKTVSKRLTDEEFKSVDGKKKKELQVILKSITGLEDKIQKEKDEIKEIAQNNTAVLVAAQQMLQKWEAGDPEVIALWETMNGWVYAGFAETYKTLGVDFDQYYYESQTYLLGKDSVDEGLEKGVFYKKPDGSVWIDLTADGLDEKLVLRANGTSVYMTQDLGTAQLKYNQYNMGKSIYVVGNEQDYHFKVLFLILQKLGKSWAKGLFHLSYGMVDLPSGKMKSREGTVVDADDLMEEMKVAAKAFIETQDKIQAFPEEEQNELFEMVAMAQLKYFLLKVDPSKRLLFDPNEPIDIQGNTGPFIQYTHARIRSVLNKGNYEAPTQLDISEINAYERDLILTLNQFPDTIMQAARDYSPALIANYAYEVAKTYNKFYQENYILQAETEALKQFRLMLSAASAGVIKRSMALLGIKVPERM